MEFSFERCSKNYEVVNGHRRLAEEEKVTINK